MLAPLMRRARTADERAAVERASGGVGRASPRRPLAAAQAHRQPAATQPAA